MSCKGMCEHSIKRESIKGYHRGQRFCAMCKYFIETDELFCICCRKMYRRGKRHNKIW